MAPRSWEELVAAGRRARMVRDAAQWALGDLSLQVEKVYGQNRLAAYAREVGVEPSTLKEYRRVATRYDKLAESFRCFVLIGFIRIWLKGLLLDTA